MNELGALYAATFVIADARGSDNNRKFLRAIQQAFEQRK